MRAGLLLYARWRITFVGMKLFAVAGWLCLLVAVAAVNGCATNRINWAERVGYYTHDQAVLELGPPG